MERDPIVGPSRAGSNRISRGDQSTGDIDALSGSGQHRVGHSSINPRATVAGPDTPGANAIIGDNARRANPNPSFNTVSLRRDSIPSGHALGGQSDLSAHRRRVHDAVAGRYALRVTIDRRSDVRDPRGDPITRDHSSRAKSNGDFGTAGPNGHDIS